MVGRPAEAVVAVVAAGLIGTISTGTGPTLIVFESVAKGVAAQDVNWPVYGEVVLQPSSSAIVSVTGRCRAAV